MHENFNYATASQAIIAKKLLAAHEFPQLFASRHRHSPPLIPANKFIARNSTPFEHIPSLRSIERRRKSAKI
jgi:hypothetical protein